MKFVFKLIILSFAVLVLSGFGFSNNFVLAISSGPLGPGTMSTSNASGGTKDWILPDMAKIDDSSYTQAQVGYTAPVLCLYSETLVLVENGSKKIKELNQGDLVYSYNFMSKKSELKKVSGVFSRSISYYNNKYYHIYFEGGDIKTTYNHYFYVGKNLIMAKDLKQGDKLFDILGQEKLINNIVIEENYTDYVWDISVEDNYNFFANGVLVHNVGATYDKYIRIIKSDGTIGSTERASVTAWGASAFYTYGGEADLWGESWTASDINDSDFGIAVSVYGSGYADGNYTTYYLKATNFGFNIPVGSTIDGIKAEIDRYAFGSSATNAYIDYIRITVTYTPSTNTTPNIPALVSPANASKITDDTPTLSANYSDPDVGDIGTINYRISSGTAQNCLDNTNIVASGTSSATSDEDEDITYTPGSSIGISATYYWCAQNDDGVAQSAWTSMGNFILDTTTPDIVVVDAGASSADRISFTSNTYFKYTSTGSDDQLSFSWTDPSSVSDDTFYYELNTDSGNTVTGDESTTTNAYIDNITITEGTNYFHVRPKNGAGTWGTERIFIIKYDKITPIISNTANSLGYLSNTQTATITWATDEASSTQVEYGLTNSYGSITTETDTTTRVTSHTVDVAFTPCQLYYVRVISKDQAQNQATGDNFTIQTQCASGGNAGQVFSIQPITPSQTNQNSNNNQEISQQDPRITLMQKIIELLKEMIRILMQKKG